MQKAARLRQMIWLLLKRQFPAKQIGSVHPRRKKKKISIDLRVMHKIIRGLVDIKIDDLLF